MSIISKIKAALSGGAAAPVVAVAASIGSNELDRAVIAAKSTEIGSAAIAAVHAAEVPGATGTAKRAQAVAAVAPVIALYVAKTGLAAVVHDLETFAGLVIESTLADLRITGPSGIALAVLKLAVAAT